MKKFLLFMISFTLVFLILQTASGMIITTIYPVSVGDAWSQSASLPQETMVSGSILTSVITLFIVLISAAAAYFVQKIFPQYKLIHSSSPPSHNDMEREVS